MLGDIAINRGCDTGTESVFGAKWERENLLMRGDHRETKQGDQVELSHRYLRSSISGAKQTGYCPRGMSLCPSLCPTLPTGLMVPHPTGSPTVGVARGSEEDIWVAANFLTSSYRAKMVAIRAGLERTLLEGSLALFTDSCFALQVLQNGPAEQSTLLGTEVWDLQERFSMTGRPVHLQEVPSHC
jgi:hypothetical protein